jgi:DNA-binding CsgD family transcriptional regulator
MGIKECLASCDTVSQLCEEALNHISRRINSQGGLFLLSPDAKSFDLRSAVRKDIGDEFHQAYSDYYHKMDPFAAMILSGAVTQPALTEQMVPWKKFVGTRYYREFMRRISFRQAMTIPLLSTRGLIGNIVLISPPDTLFSKDQLGEAFLVQPIIELSLEKILVLEKITQQTFMIRFLVDREKQKGMIVLDDSLLPVHQNEKARDLIKRCYNKDYDGLKLPKALEACLEGMICSKDRMAFVTESDPYTNNVRVSLSRLEYSEGKKCYLLLFEPTLPSMEVLRQIGLSKRECEVVSLSCEGFKNCEIAKKLFISEATVENHLSHIYEKTGVSNRTYLAHKIQLLLQGHTP